MYEFENFLDKLFNCLLYLLIWFIEISFSCMFGLFCGQHCWFYLVSLLVFCWLVISQHRMVSLSSCFCLRWLYFLNLRWCRVFFVSVSSDANFWIFSYFTFSSIVLIIESVWSIFLLVSLMVFTAECKTWLINARKNSSRLEYQWSINSCQSFQFLFQVWFQNLLGKVYLWCIRKENLYGPLAGPVWLLINLSWIFDAKLEKLLTSLNFG